MYYLENWAYFLGRGLPIILRPRPYGWAVFLGVFHFGHFIISYLWCISQEDVKVIIFTWVSVEFLPRCNSPQPSASNSREIIVLYPSFPKSAESILQHECSISLSRFSRGKAIKILWAVSLTCCWRRYTFTSSLRRADVHPSRGVIGNSSIFYNK